MREYTCDRCLIDFWDTSDKFRLKYKLCQQCQKEVYDKEHGL